MSGSHTFPLSTCHISTDSSIVLQMYLHYIISLVSADEYVICLSAVVVGISGSVILNGIGEGRDIGVAGTQTVLKP